MIFKVFLEISRTKNLQPDFQIAGTNVFRNLNTFQIIYQNYRWQGGGIQIISPPPFFLLNHQREAPLTPQVWSLEHFSANKLLSMNQKIFVMSPNFIS